MLSQKELEDGIRRTEAYTPHLIQLVVVESPNPPPLPSTLHRWADPTQGVDSLQGLMAVDLSRLFKALNIKPYIIAAPGGRYYQMQPAKGPVEIPPPPEGTAAIAVIVRLY